jgi:L-iditol 2-dehydrogenase
MSKYSQFTRQAKLPLTMKAAVMDKPGSIVIKEVPVPEVGESR